MLSANEDLRYATVLVAVFQSLLQLSVVHLVHVDILGHHANAQVVEEVENVAALLEGSTNPAKSGDVHHHLPPLNVELRQKTDVQN